MPYSFVAKSLHTKKLSSRLSSTEIHFCARNAHFAFLSHLLRGLGVTYAIHLKLIEKLLVYFLLVIINFFTRCYGRGATREYRLKLGSWRCWRDWSIWPKILGRRGRPHKPFFVSEDRLIELSYGITMRAEISYFLSQKKRLTNRRMDGIGMLTTRPRLHSCNATTKKSYRQRTFNNRAWSLHTKRLLTAVIADRKNYRRVTKKKRHKRVYTVGIAVESSSDT